MHLRLQRRRVSLTLTLNLTHTLGFCGRRNTTALTLRGLLTLGSVLNIVNERVGGKSLDSVYREITLKSGEKNKQTNKLGIKIVLEKNKKIK